MRILLITNYWFPYNNPGAIRWTKMSEFLDIKTVITAKEPKRGFLDYSMPHGWSYDNKRFGVKWSALIWGFVASILSLFYRKYDVYVFTSPPESLLFGAWLNQLLGRKVVIDMRDSIDRENQKNRFMAPLYNFLYKRIKNKIVCWKFLDPDAEVIYHGHENISINPRVEPYYYKRVNNMPYIKYVLFLSCGHFPSYKDMVGTKNYAKSSVTTIRHLGFNPDVEMHPEVYTFKPVTYRESAIKLKKYLEKIHE